MKTLAVLTLALLSAPAIAGTITCSTGTMGEDTYKQIVLQNNSVEFNLHETHFTAGKSDIVRNGNSVAILGKKLKGTVEGDTFSAKVDALLVFDAAKKTLSLTLLLDNWAQIPTTDLLCE